MDWFDIGEASTYGMIWGMILLLAVHPVCDIILMLAN